MRTILLVAITGLLAACDPSGGGATFRLTGDAAVGISTRSAPQADAVFWP